jgi:hypothetical protein
MKEFLKFGPVKSDRESQVRIQGLVDPDEHKKLMRILEKCNWSLNDFIKASVRRVIEESKG